MRRARLQKHLRLLKAAEFNRVFERSLRSSDRFFTVLARTNNLPHARLGLAISKKRAARAVSRNRLKRLIRENFRQATNRIEADYVVLAGHASVSADNATLFRSLHKHLDNIKKQCTESSQA